MGSVVNGTAARTGTGAATRKIRVAISVSNKAGSIRVIVVLRCGERLCELGSAKGQRNGHRVGTVRRLVESVDHAAQCRHGMESFVPVGTCELYRHRSSDALDYYINDLQVHQSADKT